MKPTQTRIGNLWCKLMHTDPMWPSHGHYECRTCGRRHQVCWEYPMALPIQAQADRAVRSTRQSIPQPGIY